MPRKGYYATGQRNAKSKLTPELVREIRASSESDGKIAKRLGISRSNISKIRRREIWDWVID